jgi:MEMO1 family protein
MSKDIRKSVIAGSWYPGDPKILRKDIEDYFNKAIVDKIEDSIVGLVAPHAGYIYSGQIAAYAYKPIRKKLYDNVFVISPSHRMAFPGVSVYLGGGYETPLGVVHVNKAMAGKLMSYSRLVDEIPAAHMQEHALEIQLPFLQVALGDFSFVPLIMGNQDATTCEELANAIFQSAGDSNNLIVGSSDLSHFYDYNQAVKKDSIFLENLGRMDAQGMLTDLKSGRCEACGGGPATVTVMTSKMMGASEAKILQYANSGDVTGDKGRVVGYASAIFIRK